MVEWDAGVDWLTMTFKRGHKDYDRAILAIRQHMTLEVDKAGAPEPVKRLGYIGLKQGSLMYGERADSLIVQVSGAKSKQIVKLFMELGIDGKPTRIDLQVTGKTTEKPEGYLRAVSGRVQEARGAQAGRKAQNTTDYKNRGRSTGMVIGSRSSENYSRIYDKSAEQRGKIEPGLVRFENECKGKRARLAWNMVRNSADPYYAACSIVKGTMESHNVDMDFLKKVERIEMPSSYEPSRLDKQCDWLEKHVKPTVQNVVKYLGRDYVLQLLGLD